MTSAGAGACRDMRRCGEAGLVLVLALLPLLPVCVAIGCSSPDTLFTSQTVLTHPGTPDTCYQVGCPSGVTRVIEERSGVPEEPSYVPEERSDAPEEQSGVPEDRSGVPEEGLDSQAIDRHCGISVVDLRSQLFSTRHANYLSFNCTTAFLLSTEAGLTIPPITWHVYCESGDFSVVTHLVAMVLTRDITTQQAKDVVEQVLLVISVAHILKGAASCTMMCDAQGYCYPCDTGPAGGVTAVLMELPVANIDPVAFSADLVRWVAEGEGLSINCTEASLGVMATNGSTTLCGQRFELTKTCPSDVVMHGPPSALTRDTDGGTLSYVKGNSRLSVCWYLTCPDGLVTSLLGLSDTQVSVSCDGRHELTSASGQSAFSCSENQAVVSIAPFFSAPYNWTWEYYCQNDTSALPFGCHPVDTTVSSQGVVTHPGTPDACYQVGCPSGVTYVIEERSGVSQPLAMDRHCSDQAVDLSSQLFSPRNVNYFAFSCKTSFLLSTEGGRTTAPITWHVYCESGDFSVVTHLVAMVLTRDITTQQAKDIVQLSNSMRDPHILKGAASCTGLCGPDGYCYPCDTGPAGGVTAVLMELPVANIDPVAFSADLVRWVAEGEGLSINCTEASLGAMATNGSTTLCGKRFELLGTAVCSDTALHGPVSAVTAGTTGGTLSYNGELGTTPLCWYLTCPGRLAISLLGPSDTQVSVSCDGMKDVSPGSGHTALSCSQDQAVVSILPLSSALRTWTWEYYCQNDTVDVPSPAQALFEVPSGGSTATDLATALVAAASALPTTTSATCLYLCDTSLCVPCGKSNTSTTADAVVVEMFLSSRYNLALANNALRSWVYGGTNPDEPCSSLAYSLQDTKVVVGCGRQLPVGEYRERSVSGVAVETGTAVFLACVLCLGSCLTVAIGAAVVYQVAPAVKNDGGPLDAADLIVIDSEPTDTMPDTESRISAPDSVSAGGGAGDMEREGVSGSTGSGGSGGDVLLQPVAPVADEAASSESGSEAGGGSTASSSGSGNVDDSVLRRDPSTRIASPFDAMPVRTADGPTLFSTFPDDTIVHV